MHLILLSSNLTNSVIKTPLRIIKEGELALNRWEPNYVAPSSEVLLGKKTNAESKWKQMKRCKSEHCINTEQSHLAQQGDSQIMGWQNVNWWRTWILWENQIKPSVFFWLDMNNFHLVFFCFLFFVTLNLKVVCFFVFCTSAQLQTWNPSIPTCDYAPTVQKSLRPAYTCIYNSDIWTVESPQPQNIKDSAILRITALSYNLLLNQSTVCWKVLHHYLIFCHFVCYHQC